MIPTPKQSERELLREKFAACGIDGMDELEVLTLFLSYAVQCGDTMETAQALLEKFGDLGAIFSASVATLKGAGLSEHVATLIHTVFAVRSEMTLRSMRGCHLDTLEKSGRLLRDYYIGKEVESVLLLTLDEKYRVIDVHPFSEGSVTFADYSLRAVAEHVMYDNARYAIFAHNHPHGYAEPSSTDVHTTQSLHQLLSRLNVTLLDHVLVADGAYTSIMLHDRAWDLEVGSFPEDRSEFQ